MNPSVISPQLSRKFSNMSLFCSFLIITHHFSVCGNSAPGFIGIWELFLRGNAGGGWSWIAVPWFFLASGFFLAGHMEERGWWKREVVKRCRSLVIPFFFWCGIGVVIVSLSDLVMHRDFFFNSVEKILYGIGFNPFGIFNPTASSLWFVRALMLFVVISPMLKKFLSFKLLLVLGVIYAVIAPFDSAVLYRVFRYGFSLEGLFYFTLGLYLRYHPIGVAPPTHGAHTNTKILVVGAICFVSGAVLVFLPCLANLNGLICGYVQWIATPLLLFGTWAFIPSTQWPLWLVSCSFPIYVMHRIVLFVYNSLSRNVPFMQCRLLQEPSIISWSIIAIVVFAVPIITAALLRKLTPRLASTIFGGR